MTVKIETERLILRSIKMDDAERINFLCNDQAVTSTTLRIPYPSALEDTKKFIETSENMDIEKGVVFTIILKSAQEIIGVMGLGVEPAHEKGELGYWLGKEYWGRGYCTEAAKAVLEYGFNTLKLNRIYANYMKGNEASGRIMQKIGMQYEGCLKEHVKKNGLFKDVECYGVLKKDYSKNGNSV